MLKQVRVGLLALAGVCLSVAVPAQQVPPSADTFTSSAVPKANFGNVEFLAVAPGTNTYISFNLSSVPAGSTVTRATLRLFVNGVATGGKFSVYDLPSSPAWAESTLTHNSPLPLGASASTSNPITVSSASVNNFLLIDITQDSAGLA